MTLRVHDYHDGNRQLQDRFDSRRLADHLVERVSETIGPVSYTHLRAHET